MTKKYSKRINGGLAIYFGFGSFITGILSILAIFILLYKNWAEEADYGWGTFVGMIVIGVIMLLFGYALLRTGYEEIED